MEGKVLDLEPRNQGFVPIAFTHEWTSLVHLQRKGSNDNIKVSGEGDRSRGA